MSSHDHAHDEPPARGFWSSPMGWVFIAFLLISGALMFTEHRAHVLGLWLWVPLIACPLLHMFMHGGHGGHAGHRRRTQSNSEGKAQ